MTKIVEIVLLLAAAYLALGESIENIYKLFGKFSNAEHIQDFFDDIEIFKREIVQQGKTLPRFICDDLYLR